LPAVALDSLEDICAKAASAQLAKELGSVAYELLPLLTALLMESFAPVCITQTVKQNQARNFARRSLHQ
jgi:hypothetical protein